LRRTRSRRWLRRRGAEVGWPHARSRGDGAPGRHDRISTTPVEALAKPRRAPGSGGKSEPRPATNRTSTTDWVPTPSSSPVAEAEQRMDSSSAQSRLGLADGRDRGSRAHHGTSTGPREHTTRPSIVCSWLATAPTALRRRQPGNDAAARQRGGKGGARKA
jgi:hypothetical protein